MRVDLRQVSSKTRRKNNPRLIIPNANQKQMNLSVNLRPMILKENLKQPSHSANPKLPSANQKQLNLKDNPRQPSLKTNQ